jgi:alpha-galactosidase/6-phospho-beta-glucosidase family protein
MTLPIFLIAAQEINTRNHITRIFTMDIREDLRLHRTGIGHTHPVTRDRMNNHNSMNSLLGRIRTKMMRTIERNSTDNIASHDNICVMSSLQLL